MAAKKKRGFALYGAACGSYVDAQAGIVPKDDDGRALRIATLVHVVMQTRHEDQAVALIKEVAKRGLEKAAAVCTAKAATGE